VSQDDRDRWDARYRQGDFPTEPSAVLVAIEALLPRRGRALDLGGGAGRHAIWLARRGLEVTLADVSAVALERAREAAARAGVAVRAVAADLEAAAGLPAPVLAASPFDVVVAFHYLPAPSLFAALPAALAPGGVFILVQPTRRNLERHERPPARFLLDEGEARRLLPPGLEVVSDDEGWLEDGRHEARVVARRPRPKTLESTARSR